MAGFSNKSQTARGTQTVVSEINITPLVDVMLVLLIVFMISAPMMQQGIQVDLPKANAPSLGEPPEQIILTIQKDRKILMNDNIIPSGSLVARLEAIVSAKPNLEVFIQADQSVPYGFVAKTMAELKSAKIQRVGLVTEPQ